MYINVSKMCSMAHIFETAQFALLLGSFAKETYDFKEPTNRSHPIDR